MTNKALRVIAFIVSTQSMNAQTVIDTVTTGPGYVNNIWYSLENDNQSEQINNNWDLALSTTISPSSDLSTALLFNHKIGQLFEIPGSDPTNFNGLDTTGLSALPPLFNSDSAWSKGGFNNTPTIGTFDYGWGTYDFVTHTGINSNRIFVIKYNSGIYKKLKIDLSFMSSSYTLTYSDLDNSNSEIEVIPLSSYSSKNFIYFSLNDGIVDREPISENWDLTFMQYPSFDYDPPYTVAGIFQNVGVEIAKAYPVNNPSTYENWSSEEFSPRINGIGYDWKTFSGSWTIADSTVYFVKDKAGSYWKVILTGFGGSSNGQYIFSKEKLSSANINSKETTVLGVYPNPANLDFNLITNSNENGIIQILNQQGQIVIEKAFFEGLNTNYINTSFLASGTYTIFISSETNSIIYPIQIQH
jgi:hypothetical protein